MGREAKTFEPEHEGMMHRWKSKKWSNAKIGQWISQERGAYQTSITAAERRRRTVSRETVRRFFALHKTSLAQNAESASKTSCLHKTVLEVDGCHPEPQVESSEDRVATAGPVNAAPVKGERDPLVDGHDAEGAK